MVTAEVTLPSGPVGGVHSNEYRDTTTHHEADDKCGYLRFESAVDILHSASRTASWVAVATPKRRVACRRFDRSGCLPGELAAWMMAHLAPRLPQRCHCRHQ